MASDSCSGSYRRKIPDPCPSHEKIPRYCEMNSLEPAAGNSIETTSGNVYLDPASVRYSPRTLPAASAPASCWSAFCSRQPCLMALNSLSRRAESDLALVLGEIDLAQQRHLGGGLVHDFDRAAQLDRDGLEHNNAIIGAVTLQFLALEL